MDRLPLYVAILFGVAAAIYFAVNAAPSADALVSDIASEYEAKLANPDYEKWKSQPGLPKGFQSFAEEARIKRARSSLAAMAVAPAAVEPLLIPLTTTPPEIDGRLEAAAWDGARVIEIGVDGAETWLYLMTDGERLFVGCDVPSDRSGAGFDQLRFGFHVGLCPLIDSERIHVGTSRNDVLGGIRHTSVQWSGTPATGRHDRWKNSDISDWRIYEKARGLSSFVDHRQYEACLDLAECGLHPGIPFASFVEVETDPARDFGGRFSHRLYAGRLGSHEDAVWMVLQQQ